MEINRKALEALQIQSWPRSDWQWPKLQAHRGYCMDGQTENSLASLAAAKEKGFEMAEIDVRLSADNIPVLSHDEDLSRLIGRSLKVEDLTAKELAGFQIATLAEVLETRNRPEKINIEIKRENVFEPKVSEQVIKLLKKSKHQDEVIVSSFNPLELRKFSEELPDIPRAFLIEFDKVPMLSYLRLAGNLIAKGHMVNWPHQLLNAEIIKFLKDAGIPVAVWTVNDYRQARSLLDSGVDSVITDRVIPELL